MRVQKQMGALHEPDPHPACGHPLPSDPGYAGGFAEASGRGAGGEGSFSVEVHGPNSRAHDVQVKALHVQHARSVCGAKQIPPPNLEPSFKAASIEDEDKC